MTKYKICIVTPDIIGPIKNGGIGTACYYLAKVLVEEAGYEVTVLYTGPIEMNGLAQYKRFYQVMGIDFLGSPDLPPEKPYPEHGSTYFQQLSARIKEFLSVNHFDIVHFQDWQANGFVTIQTKRTTSQFQKTTLIVTIHSPSAWIREGNLVFSANPLHDAKLDYMEAYSIQHADYVISPSQYLIDWLQRKGWKISVRKRILRNLFEPSAEITKLSKSYDFTHLIFFGRLETRKGLHIFIQSLDFINRHYGFSKVNIKKISFVGKPVILSNGENSINYIRSKTAKWLNNNEKPVINITIKDTLDTFEAIKYIKNSGGIAIMPSLVDNYPYAVIECICYSIPFLCSNHGGMTEMVSREATFAPNVASLCDAILNREHRIKRLKTKYNFKTAQNAMLNFHRAILKTESKTIQTSQAKVDKRKKVRPKVSVCIAHYNHGKYLPQLLHSLDTSNYDNMEVIVVDDGSTDKNSIHIFQRLTNLYRKNKWQFIAKSTNEGLSKTRNVAAKYATGDYLIFMDADNIAMPNMVSCFVEGMQRSSLDCLTAYFWAFTGDKVPDINSTPMYSYTPIGPCIELGILENVFGDANFCIKREVFEALNGFTEDRTTSWEDWEFLAKLNLMGYKQDVIPEYIFWYRCLEQGFSRITNHYANHIRVLKSYYTHGSSLQQQIRLIDTITVPLYYAYLNKNSSLNLNRLGYKITGKLYSVIDRVPTIRKALRFTFQIIVMPLWKFYKQLRNYFKKLM